MDECEGGGLRDVGSGGGEEGEEGGLCRLVGWWVKVFLLYKNSWLSSKFQESSRKKQRFGCFHSQIIFEMRYFYFFFFLLFLHVFLCLVSLEDYSTS